LLTRKPKVRQPPRLYPQIGKALQQIYLTADRLQPAGQLGHIASDVGNTPRDSDACAIAASLRQNGGFRGVYAAMRDLAVHDEEKTRQQLDWIDDGCGLPRHEYLQKPSERLF
jgi:hypothetical protein